MSDHKHPADPARVAAAREGALSGREAREVSEQLGVISEPVRVRILSALLAADQICVGDIALALDLSEDAVSYGLRVLRANGLVTRERRGRMVYYRLAGGPERTPLTEALKSVERLGRLP